MQDTLPPSVCSISTRHWSLEKLLQQSENFRLVTRVPLPLAKSRLDNLQKTGEPLIIEGLHEHPEWPRDMFSVDWLSRYGTKDITVRNIYDRTDSKIPFHDFIAKCRSASVFAEPGELQRLYGKDAECPIQWSHWLHEAKVVPEALLPDNDRNLLHQQPQTLRVETLMCYLGIGDTYTPCHKDLCASSGQNLMCHTENGGSSFWLMTKSSDANKVSEYFHQLQQEIDHESYVLTIDELAKAPFHVYIAEQQLGDLVLVPPRSCHQVINYGGITIKTSWSRMTLKGLEIAYYHELPIYQRVCRPEIYRVKSTIYHTLLRETKRLERASLQDYHMDLAKQADLKKLLQLYDALLADEYSPTHEEMLCLHNSDVAHSVTENSCAQVVCDFCGADIFQSFFECRECVHRSNSASEQPVAHGDGYVICAGCYVEGRSCNCDKMDPIQCRPFVELLEHRTRAAQILSTNGPISTWDSENYLNTGTFRAACILRKLKKDKRDIKTCSTLKHNQSSHTVPFSWALNCKKCHRAKCFMHILIEHKLHVIDALLTHSRDVSHEQYHLRHLGSSRKFENGLIAFKSSQTEGSTPDFSQQHVYNALTYSSCRPSNPTFTCLGYYDQLRLDVTSDHPDEYPDRSRKPDSTSSTSCPSAIQQNCTLTSSTEMVVGGRGQRHIFDYVDVPSAPYRITKQSQSGCSEMGEPQEDDLALPRRRHERNPTCRKRLRLGNLGTSDDDELLLGRLSTIPQDLHFKKKINPEAQTLASSDPSQTAMTSSTGLGSTRSANVLGAATPNQYEQPRSAAALSIDQTHVWEHDEGSKLHESLPYEANPPRPSDNQWSHTSSGPISKGLGDAHKIGHAFTASSRPHSKS